MFGRVIFLLYLPAICFSFALFPNAGHKTQRRQNPENMVNVSYGQAEEDPCMGRLSPCVQNLRDIFAVNGPQDVVVDGRLAVPCESNLLEESRNCIGSASECRNHDLYRDMQSAQMPWEFICQNSQAFVSGEDCWRSSNLTTTIRGCLHPYIQCVPTCIRKRVAEVPDCSAEEAKLLGRLAVTVLDESEVSC
ncbi:uncharacterized protein LOC124274569 [Haliotis rubra]|uniref:uncharacterized protein LOC124274569 n=1 Tax=Haliotis rubra TaxID=36100 RepID=UPI001EE5EAB9|nr:uncharacterized protein LOC124274569 [Haliotis rubra]